MLELRIQTEMVCRFRVLEKLFTGGQTCAEVEAVPATQKVKGYRSFGRKDVAPLYHLPFSGVKFC